MRGSLPLAQPAGDRRLVVHVRVGAVGVDRVLHLATLLVRGHGCVLRLVDRQLQIVRTHAVALGVGVRERPTDEHLVVGEVEPVDEHPRPEGDLLVLGEEVLRHPVERHRPDLAQREDVLRPHLRVVEGVEVELGVVVVVHELDVQLPRRVVPRLDRVVEVLGVRAEGLPLDHRTVGCRVRRDALGRQPVVLDQLGLTRLVHPLVGVHAEALHRPQARRQTTRAEHEGHHVHGLGRLAEEVEGPLGDARLEGHRVGLLRVDEVRELHGVPDEEHPQVVAHQVPVAVLGVELHGEAARVARHLRGVPATRDCREPHGDVGLLARLLEQPCPGVPRDRLVADGAVSREGAVGEDTTGVHHTLGDALAVEVADLLEEVVVLQGRRTTGSDGALVLVVVDGVSLTGGQHGAVVPGCRGLRRDVSHEDPLVGCASV